MCIWHVDARLKSELFQKNAWVTFPSRALCEVELTGFKFQDTQDNKSFPFDGRTLPTISNFTGYYASGSSSNPLNTRGGCQHVPDNCATDP